MPFITTGTNFSDNINYMIIANITNVSSNASGPLVVNIIGANITNITIDNTPPTVTFVGSGGNTNPDLTDNATYINSTSAITINFTVIDSTFRHMTGPCNVTLDPTNSTLGASLNGTSEFANNTNFVLAFTLTPSLEGLRNYRVECRDNVDTNNTGNTTIRTLAFDLSPPFINISFFDLSQQEKIQFGLGSEVTIKCKRADTISGFNLTQIFLQNPFDSQLNSKRIDISSATGTNFIATEFVIPSSETEQLGTYTAACHVTDKAGIIHRVNKTFEIITQAPLSSSAFGIPGFSAPVGKTKINSGVTSDGGKLGPDGISRLMQAGGSLKLDIKGQDHTVTIVTIT
ncbi:MAG: hypothetical protein AABX72_01625, partial [Nanoarchaeota archaeon]